MTVVLRGLSCSVQKANFSSLQRGTPGHQGPSPDVTTERNILVEHCFKFSPKMGLPGVAQTAGGPGQGLLSPLAILLPKFYPSGSESGGWWQVVTQVCVSHLLTLLEQLFLHRTVAFYCPYKVFNSVVTISLPHVLLYTTSADREAGYFFPLVHLHIEKQCPAQNIILIKPSSLPAYRNDQNKRQEKMSLKSVGHLYPVQLHQLFITRSFCPS